MPMPWRRATIVSEGDVYSWSCCCRFDVRATGIAIPGTDPDYGGFASPCVDSHPCVDAGFLSPDGRAKCIHCVSSSFGIIDSASSRAVPPHADADADVLLPPSLPFASLPSPFTCACAFRLTLSLTLTLPSTVARR
jgi:hypothetical protein